MRRLGEAPSTRDLRLRFPRGFLCLIGITAVGLLCTRAIHAEEESAQSSNPVVWQVSSGIDYSVGDYGLDRDTQLLFVPFSVEATADRFRGRATLPLLSLEGPTGFLPDTGGTGVVDELDVESEFGLGQLVLSGSYLLGQRDSVLPYLETTVRITAPTETKRELGAGLWSGALQFDAFDTYGRITPFARVGRRFYEGDALDDRFYTSVGASVRLIEGAVIGLAYDWLEATSGAVEDAHQLSPFLSFRWAGRYRVGPYAVVGVSEGAPDFGLGCALSVRL